MKDQTIKNKAAAEPVKKAIFQGAPKISNATDSSSNTTGALLVSGGAGFGKSVTIGENLTIHGNFTVDGTTTTVNSSTVTIDDAALKLADNQGDTTTFKEYQTKLPQQSVEWYDDQGIYNNMPQVPDPYGVLFSLAQDGKHNEMVEEQYKD